MNNCQNCGSNVSASFARVYGDNDNKVHRCFNCVEGEDGGRRILRAGGGAIKNQEKVLERMNSRSA